MYLCPKSLSFSLGLSLLACAFILPLHGLDSKKSLNHTTSLLESSPNPHKTQASPTPTIIHTQDILTHLSIFNQLVLVGDASGNVEIYSLEKLKSTHQKQSGTKHTKAIEWLSSFSLPPITDYFGNTHKSRIYDISTFNGEEIFILSEGSKGTKQIFSLNLKNKQPPKLIYQTHTAPKRIIAYDKNHLLIGFLSNEIALLDLSNQRLVYKTQPSFAGFSDMCINAPFVFSTDESGQVNVLDLHTGELLTRLDSVNKDNNYTIASAKNTILTASVDRKVGLYHFSNTKGQFLLHNAKSIQSEFLVYAVGISPDGKLGAYSKNEQNDIAIFDILTQKELIVLPNSGSILNKLIFYNSHTLLAGSDDKFFTLWRF